jgi:serine phosphatase RsbU (regulator of sigma subunit)
MRPEPTGPGTGHQPTALVVDDDPDINRLLQVRMRTAGFAVRSAGDGEQALAAIAEEAPDLMLLDVSMPGMGGLEVLERVRAERLDIAVIMSTAFGSERVAIEALRKGADDYLRKPFEPTELRAVVERTASRLLLRRENAELQRQLDAELRRASEVQTGLLPQAAPDVPGYELAAAWVPARTVGGDFYDWQVQADGSLSLVIGDVMGKGMPAALLMATLRAALRPVLAAHPPATALRLVERALTEDLERAESFATLFLVHLDPQRHVARYVDAGHGLAAVARADGSLEETGPGDLPLGVMRDPVIREREVALGPGDTLILYSDGLTDALPEADSANKVIRSSVAEAPSAPALADRLATIARSEGTPIDDVTVAVLRRLPAGTP